MALRHFNKTTIGQDCSELTGAHENELFYGCEFDKLNGLTLKHCVLNGSALATTSVKNALGFTVTLDCFSFDGVELSPLLFDLYLSLLLMTKGNEDKKELLIEVIGRKRAESLQRLLKCTE